MENLVEVTSVPVIVTIVCVVLAVFKHFVKSEKVIAIIPVIAAVIGGGLGVLAFFYTPEMIPADNIFTAILIGIASGLAATGSHQLFKQIAKSAEQDKQQAASNSKDKQQPGTGGGSDKAE